MDLEFFSSKWGYSTETASVSSWVPSLQLGKATSKNVVEYLDLFVVLRAEWPFTVCHV